MNAPFPRLDVPRVAKLRVEDFLLLNESGAFDDYSKSELIDGEITCINAQFSRHARAKTRLMSRLGACLLEVAPKLEVLGEVAVRLSDDSMPEPDVLITDYAGDGPVPLESVALIVEVADSTVDYDLGRKARIYAQAGVPEYWVLDIANGRLIVYTAPEGKAYSDRSETPLGIDAVSVTIPGLSVSTGNLVA